jgi:nicotinamide-nucleotide amidase
VASPSRVLVLSIGEELLQGRVVDTNAAYVAEQCLRLGLEVVAMETCGDAPGQLSQVFHRWQNQVELIISSGGLGPTEDDRVRAETAHFLAVDLVEIADAIPPLERLFQRILLQDAPVHFLNQGRMPSGARPWPNVGGTAWAFEVALSPTCIFMSLPGPPHEVRAVWEEGGLGASLGERFGATEEMAFGTFHTVGVPEAKIELEIRQMLEPGRNPKMGITAHGKVVTLSALAKAEAGRSAENILEETASTLASALGPLLFGRNLDTLESVVVAALQNSGQTLALAESCTGGQVAQAITAVPGASQVFTHGWVTYADAAKISQLDVSADLIQERGAVSAPVAEKMAAGARARSGADWALSITGIAGPEGGSTDKPVGLVWMALAGPDGVKSVRRQQWIRAGRAGIQQGAVRDALDLLRRELLNLPSLDSTPPTS